MGTPAYMAPEQIRDSATVDARADIFSLGCILYGLMCGQTAFTGPDMVSIWNRVCNGEYTPPRRARPDLPQRFVDAIDGALKVKVGERFSTVEELVAALDGPGSTKGEAPRVHRNSSVLSWILAGGLAVAVMGIFALAGIALIGVAWYQAGAPPNSTEETDIPVVEAPESLAVCTADGEPGARIGWVRSGGTRLGERQLKRGQTWIAPEDTEVMATAAGTVAVCRLPKGSRVEAVDSPSRIARSGVWVAVTVGGLTLP